MFLSQYDYNLPEELIAKRPQYPRDNSRLLIVNRKTKKIEINNFINIKKFFSSDDLCIFNNTKVLKILLKGKKKNENIREILLISQESSNTWKILTKKPKEEEIDFDKTLKGFLFKRTEEWFITFNQKPDLFIENNGLMPIPPYLDRESDKKDLVDYQTIYASEDGSIAAPTAGLHFTKNYFDSSPSSYHYDLISYDISSNNSYVDSLSFKTMSNAISISNNNINFKIKHSIYKNNHYDLTNSGDIDFMLTSIKKFKNNSSVDFFINYCPIGYNQKSFIFDINFYKNKRNNSHILNFMWSLKRPKLTHNIYDHVDNFNWSDFDYPSTISLKFKSIFNNRSLKISSIFRHYLNYLYFNHMILPIQSDQSVFYYNLKLEKTFKIKHISLSTVFFLQKSSDDNSLPLPLFIFDQGINYDRLVFSDIRLLSSFNMRLFSKYNMPSYFPLTDVFYNQSHTQTGMIPLTSMSIHLYKKYFSIGFILDNLHSPFYKGASLIQDYFLSPFILRTSLKWQFID